MAKKSWLSEYEEDDGFSIPTRAPSMDPLLRALSSGERARVSWDEDEAPPPKPVDVRPLIATAKALAKAFKASRTKSKPVDVFAGGAGGAAKVGGRFAIDPIVRGKTIEEIVKASPIGEKKSKVLSAIAVAPPTLLMGLLEKHPVFEFGVPRGTAAAIAGTAKDKTIAESLGDITEYAMPTALELTAPGIGIGIGAAAHLGRSMELPTAIRLSRKLSKEAALLSKAGKSEEAAAKLAKVEKINEQIERIKSAQEAAKASRAEVKLPGKKARKMAETSPEKAMEKLGGKYRAEREYAATELPGVRVPSEFTSPMALRILETADAAEKLGDMERAAQFREYARIEQVAKNLSDRYAFSHWHENPVYNGAMKWLQSGKRGDAVEQVKAFIEKSSRSSPRDYPKLFDTPDDPVAQGMLKDILKILDEEVPKWLPKKTTEAEAVNVKFEPKIQKTHLPGVLVKEPNLVAGGNLPTKAEIARSIGPGPTGVPGVADLESMSMVDLVSLEEKLRMEAITPEELSLHGRVVEAIKRAKQRPRPPLPRGIATDIEGNVLATTGPEGIRPGPGATPELAAAIEAREAKRAGASIPPTKADVARSIGSAPTLQRWVKKGIETNPLGPRGAHFSPADIESPYGPLGDLRVADELSRVTATPNPEAKVLDVYPGNSPFQLTPGEYAFARLAASPDIVNELYGVANRDGFDVFKKEVSKLIYGPPVDFSGARNPSQVIEQAGIEVARREGIDAIRLINESDPSLTEYVAITKNALSTVDELLPISPVIREIRGILRAAPGEGYVPVPGKEIVGEPPWKGQEGFFEGSGRRVEINPFDPPERAEFLREVARAGEPSGPKLLPSPEQFEGARIAESIKAGATGGKGTPNYWAGKYWETTDRFLRKMGGKAFIPKETMTRFANASRNLIHDTIVRFNDGRKELHEALSPLKHIGRKDRETAERLIVNYLDTGQSTGYEAYDDIARRVKSFLDKRFDGVALKMAESYGYSGGDVGKALDVLRENDVVLNRRTFYFPHTNERMADVLRMYRESPGNPEEALMAFRALYEQKASLDPRTIVPDDRTLERMLRSIHEESVDMTDPRVALRTVRSVAPNMELGRDLNVPGWIGDPAFYRQGDLVRALNAYNEQTAFRWADSGQFGPKGERFVEWFNQIGAEPQAREYIRKYRERILSDWSADPLVGHESAFLSGVRSYQAANKLGQMALANVFQSFITTYEKAFQGLPTTEALKNIFQTMPVLARELIRIRGVDGAYEDALRIGAVYDDLLDDLASLHRGSSGTMTRLARMVLTTTGGRRTERVNNIVAAYMGKLWADDIARVIRGEIGGKWSNPKIAERQIRDLLEANPDMAERFIADARSGREIDPIIRDQIAYENARTTQFRGDPTMVPLSWSSPHGKLVTQFKTFGFNYGRFVKDDIIRYGARTGDWRPFSAWLASGLVTGEAVKTLRNISRGDMTKDDIEEMLESDIESIRGPMKKKMALALENAIQGGIVGLVGDTIQSVRYGDPFALARFAVGPSISQVIETPFDIARQGLPSAAAGALPIGWPARVMERQLAMPETWIEDAMEIRDAPTFSGGEWDSVNSEAEDILSRWKDTYVE